MRQTSGAKARRIGREHANNRDSWDRKEVMDDNQHARGALPTNTSIKPSSLVHSSSGVNLSCKKKRLSFL